MQRARWVRVPADVALLLAYSSLSAALGFRLGQDLSWDLQNYHYYNPHMLLTGRIDRDVHVAGLQTFLNPLQDLPLYFAVEAGVIPLAFGLVLAAWQGVALLLVHRITVMMLPPESPVWAHTVGALAAVTAAFGAGFHSQIGLTTGDSTLTVLVLAALSLLLRAPPTGARRVCQATALSGLLAGLAAGVKLTTGIFWFGLACLCVLGSGLAAARLRRLCVWGAAATGGLLLTGGYWMWLMCVHYQSPLFPFFNSVFQSPFAPADVNFVDDRFFPRTLAQTLFYPFFFLELQSLVTEPMFRDARLAFGYVALVVLAAACLWRWGNHIPVVAHEGERRLILLTVFLVASYVIWQRQFSIYRYLVPIEMLAGTLIVGCASYLIQGRRRFIAVVVPICAILVSTVRLPEWGRTPWSASFFGVDKRSLTRFEGATILLWDFPDGYLVPHFPHSASFLRLRSNWGLFEGTPMWQRITRGVSAARPGTLYLIERPADEEPEGRAATLQRLGLALDRSRCTGLRSYAGMHHVCGLTLIGR